MTSTPTSAQTSASSPNPPRPRLTLRVGVTGHRLNKLPQRHFTAIEAEVERILARIKTSAGNVHIANRDAFAPEAPCLRVVSALAEGSDRIAAIAGLALGYELECPLPFHRADYEADFQTEDSRRLFRELLSKARAILELDNPRGGGGPDEHGYEAAGLMTLRQCDLLLTIWDGDSAVGRGGTGEMVAQAVESGIPIVWIRVPNENVAPPEKLATFFIAPRKIIPRGAPDFAHTPASDDTIDSIVATLVAPPKTKEGEANPRLLSFLAETQRRSTPLFFYPILLYATFVKWPAITDFRMPKYQEIAAERWRPYFDSLPQIDARSRTNVRDVLLRRFAWADGLGTFYSYLYRGSYILNFGFAAAAVAMALVVLLSEEWEKFGTVAELVLILGIFSATLWNMVRRWHQRWLDYRHLAELMRHMRILTLTGSSTMEMRSSHIDDIGDEGAAWVNWYYRATVRELGMIGATVAKDYALATARLIARTELSEQAAYHERTEERMERLEERLDGLGGALFFFTFVICAFHLYSLLTGEHHEPDMTSAFLSGVLPAIGAALFGIRVQGEFGGVAKRSKAMHERLIHMQAEVEARTAAANLTFAQVSQIAEDATGAMVVDIGDWRFVFRSKPVTLPS